MGALSLLPSPPPDPDRRRWWRGEDVGDPAEASALGTAKLSDLGFVRDLARGCESDDTGMPELWGVSLIGDFPLRCRRLGAQLLLPGLLSPAPTSSSD